jgi:hypothetical protein
VALVLLPALRAAACGGILTKVEVRAACRCQHGCTMRLCSRAPPVETETRYRDRSDPLPERGSAAVTLPASPLRVGRRP